MAHIHCTSLQYCVGKEGCMLQGLVVTSALFVLLLGVFLFPAPPGLATDLQYVCE